MCGIIVYKGKNIAKNILNGLKHLSKRGYDMWGMSTENLKITTKKPIDEYISVEENLEVWKDETIGMGHTRWATHGDLSEKNCQPLVYFLPKKFSFCHNGIIENIKEICGSDYDCKKSDSLNLLDFIVQDDGSYLEAFDVLEILKKTKGNNAFVFSIGDKYYYYTNGRSLYQYKNIVVSDAHFSDYEFVELNGFGRINFDESELEIPECNAKTQHFMLDEIKEAHTLLQNTNPVMQFNPDYEVYFIGSGSSYNAALFLSYTYDNVNAIYSSEIETFARKIIRNDRNKLFYIVSQSGETLDTIKAVETLRKTLTNEKINLITNNKNSTLSKLCDKTICIDVGVENAVASTKTFIGTIKLFYDVVVSNNFEKLNQEVEKFVNENKFSKYIFLGNQQCYPLAKEAALKMKEVANVWTDYMPAEEIKHGPIACVDDKTLVVVMSIFDSDEIQSNIEQVKTRGAKVIYTVEHEIFDEFIFPQLLAYYTAKKLRLNPDRPKNLCKYITV